MQKLLDEKLAFAKRLKLALKNSPKKIHTAAELALQFNLRHKNDPITQQAAQKWLAGQTRPTRDKIETLADWLNVSVQWLRFGIPEQRPQASAGAQAKKGKAATISPLTEDELELLARLRNLPEHRRNLVNEIVEQFALDGEMWRE